MAHSPEFLAGLQNALRVCHDQASDFGDVSEGPMSDDPETLACEARAVGALNAMAEIQAWLESPTEVTVLATDTQEEAGLRQGARLCDLLMHQYDTTAKSRFVTPHGKALHEAMAQGALEARNAVLAAMTGTHKAKGSHASD